MYDAAAPSMQKNENLIVFEPKTKFHAEPIV